MRKFLIQLLLGLLSIIALDYIVGSTLKYFYFNQNSGLQYRTTYAIDQTEAEVLVFGSSRANHHYNSAVFESAFDKTFYNTGRDGNYIFYQTAVLQSILRRHTPELVIYDFAGSFSYREEDYDRLSSLLPYYDDSHKDVKKMIHLRGPYEPFKTFSKIYPYNSTFLNVVVGNMDFNKTKNKDINGYVPLSGMWEKEIDSMRTPDYYELDSIKIKQFRKFIEVVKKYNIQTYVVYSPIFYLYDTDYSIEMCHKICKEEGIPFYDYSKSQEFLNNKDLFSDPIHLNDEGAILFSKRLTNIIKSKNVQPTSSEAETQ